MQILEHLVEITMAKQKPIEVISAVALEPGKFYLLNLKGATHMSKEAFAAWGKAMQSYLQQHDISCLLVADPLELRAAEVEPLQRVKEETNE